jgi:hypothetical protein
VLETASAADVLAGRSLVEVIQHVLSDPEVSSLLNRIGPDGSLAGGLLERMPLFFGPANLVPFKRTSDHPRVRQRQIRCALAIERRLFFLRELLTGGKLRVTGISANTSAPAALPPDFWERSHPYVDVRSGAVYYRAEVEDEPVLVLRHARLERPDPHSVIPNAEIPSKAERRAAATSGGTAACKEWLLAEMAASPDRKPKPKEAYRTEAQARWGTRVSKEAFERAWAVALGETGANWGKAGRPRKSAG